MSRASFKNSRDPQYRAACKVAAVLRDAGYSAFFVGGCVRDALLNRPVHDIDIASSADPDEVERLFAGRTVNVGKSFGIIIVNQDGFFIDVARFRADGGYTDGRHPEGVSFSTPERDAMRRDFTINALFLEPESGEIVDYTGGREDLQNRLVRAIGDPVERFREDHLRMLRAVRFAAVLEFGLEPETRRAVAGHADWIQSVSAERIFKEFTRMLCEAPKPSSGLELLHETGLLRQFLPEVEALRGVLQPPRFHPEGDVWTHTCLMLDGTPAPRSPELAWSLLLHDVGKPATFSVETMPRTGERRIRFKNHAAVGTEITKKILLRMRSSNEFIHHVATVVSCHMSLHTLPQMRSSTVRRYLGMPEFPTLLEVLHLDLLHSTGDVAVWKQLKALFESFQTEPILPPRLVTGNDLLALGYESGPSLGELLRVAYDAQLEGRIRTKEEGLAFLEKGKLDT
ncbi:MAG: CCA tRNA nucleotidyltransferase [Kiritimatiellae bacterium]|nr:CCA tRNA nucleotidyltransferase [Kiritimatiellia bacterium]